MLDIVTLDKFTILEGGNVPDILIGVITQEEYSSLCFAYRETENQTQCGACAFECGFCVLTGLFCIFCVHPCIQVAMADFLMRRKLNRINQQYYDGVSVMTINNEGSIRVYTDRLEQCRPREAVAAIATSDHSPETQPAIPVVAVRRCDGEGEMQAAPMQVQGTGRVSSTTNSFAGYAAVGHNSPPK